jgi:hypothetical protein
VERETERETAVQHLTILLRVANVYVLGLVRMFERVQGGVRDAADGID